MDSKNTGARKRIAENKTPVSSPSEDYKQIKKIVESVVFKEFDDYSDALSGIRGDYDASFGNYGGGGGGYGQTGDLYKTFIEPFTDIAKTALWGLEKLSTRARHFLKQIMVGIPALIIPGMAVDYKQLSNELKNDLSSVDKKYGDTLKKNMEALFSTDAWLLLFMVDPSLALTETVVSKVPAVAESTLNILSGGLADKYIKKHMSEKGYEGLERHKSKDWFNTSTMIASLAGLSKVVKKNGDPVEKEQLAQDLRAAIISAAKNPELQSKIKQSDISKRMSEELINKLTEKARRVLATRTVTELNTIMGGRLSDRIKAVRESKLSGPEKQIMLKNILIEIKKVAKEEALKQLDEIQTEQPNLKSAIDKARERINKYKYDDIFDQQ